MNLRDDLKAYLDGELAPERMAEMREAIDRDPALAQEAEELGQISHTLRAAAAQPAALGLEATLRALEKAERRERKPWWPWLLPVAGMTAFLAFAVAPTMQQAKMAAKSDASVAFRETPSASVMSAPVMESAKDGDVTVNGSGDPSMKFANPAEGRQAPAAAMEPEANGAKRVRTKGLSEFSGASTRSQPTKGVRNPKVLSPSSPMQNARTGDLKGQGLPRVSDFGDARNIVIEPKESKEGKTRESAIIDIRVAEAKTPVETMVIEVDSLAEANDAARELVARMGAEESPSLVGKEERDAVSANYDAVANLNLAKPERRVILEVSEDEVAETKKRVSEAVKESQLRREAQQNRSRGSFGSPGGPGGAGGFGGGGFSQSQQAETNQGGRQQGPPDPTQQRGGGGQQAATGGQGVMQGYQGRTAAPRGKAQTTAPDVKRLADSQKSKQVAKPRKRIEVIFRIKPKPAGKLDE